MTVAVKLYLALLLREGRVVDPRRRTSTLTNELFPLPASGLRVEFREHVTAAR